MNNENIKGILQLVFSILIYYFVDNYFFYVLSKFNINPTGDAYTFYYLGKYLLIGLFIYFIYMSEIKDSRHKYAKNKFMGIIFSIGAFVILVFVNFLLNKLIGLVHEPLGYGFVNYFNNDFSLSFIINMIIDIIIRPFIVIIIFPLGVSNIIKNTNTASLLSGVLYGVLLAIGLHLSIGETIFTVLVPSIIMMLITYLYRANQSIWMVYISYMLYIGFGSFVLRYFV